MKVYLTQKNIIIAAFIFCYAIVLARVISVPLFDAGRARDSIHGDAHSDINTYSAVLYFYDFGFSKTSYLPVHHYKGDKKEKGLLVYTHYPAVPDILAGAYAKILHTTSHQWIRIFPVLLSVVFFWFIFYSLKNILPDPNAAFLSALVIVLSNYFIFWADNLHKHLYEEFLKWVYFFLLFKYYQGEKKQKGLVVVCAFIFLIVANISFEPVTYLAVVTVGMSWIYTHKIFSWENILLGVSPIIGVLLHFYQNVNYFGSVELALADMRETATLRTVGSEHMGDEMKRTLGWMDYADIPFAWLRRIERYFLIAGPAFFFLAYLGLKELRKIDTKLFSLGIVLIVATLSWNMAMTQHSLVHGFTTRHIGLFYGFIVGIGILAYIKLLKKNWEEGQWYKKAIHIGLIGYVVVMMISQQLQDYIRYGLAYSTLNN